MKLLYIILPILSLAVGSGRNVTEHSNIEVQELEAKGHTESFRHRGLHHFSEPVSILHNDNDPEKDDLELDAIQVQTMIAPRELRRHCRGHSCRRGQRGGRRHKHKRLRRGRKRFGGRGKPRQGLRAGRRGGRNNLGHRRGPRGGRHGGRGRLGQYGGRHGDRRFGRKRRHPRHHRGPRGNGRKHHGQRGRGREGGRGRGRGRRHGRKRGRGHGRGRGRGRGRGVGRGRKRGRRGPNKNRQWGSGGGGLFNVYDDNINNNNNNNNNEPRNFNDNEPEPTIEPSLNTTDSNETSTSTTEYPTVSTDESGDAGYTGRDHISVSIITGDGDGN